ncbi:hypothetical protein OIO90_001280 [Microbotryomycetes sp. JL221]|nr:hypothetical protein OIO90_001280 [Microbotryomycetes sp. JL221]
MATSDTTIGSSNESQELIDPSSEAAGSSSIVTQRGDPSPPDSSALGLSISNNEAGTSVSDNELQQIDTQTPLPPPPQLQSAAGSSTVHPLAQLYTNATMQQRQKAREHAKRLSPKFGNARLPPMAPWPSTRRPSNVQRKPSVSSPLASYMPLASPNITESKGIESVPNNSEMQRALSNYTVNASSASAPVVQRTTSSSWPSTSVLSHNASTNGAEFGVPARETALDTPLEQRDSSDSRTLTGEQVKSDDVKRYKRPAEADQASNVKWQKLTEDRQSEQHRANEESASITSSNSSVSEREETTTSRAEYRDSKESSPTSLDLLMKRPRQRAGRRSFRRSSTPQMPPVSL